MELSKNEKKKGMERNIITVILLLYYIIYSKLKGIIIISRNLNFSSVHNVKSQLSTLNR